VIFPAVNIPGLTTNREGRRFESCRARHKKRPVCRINADRSFFFSGALPAPYHNWYHKEAQEGFENM
jgi:hypothetical protein